MREKTLRLIVTFHTTAAAMAMEKYCALENVPGRLMPTPRALSADCGMAWCAPVESRAQAQGVIAKYTLEADEVCELLI